MHSVSNNKKEINSDFLRLEVDLSYGFGEKERKQKPVSNRLYTIVVVDDDSDMRSYISDCLTDHYSNIHVMEAENGKVAYQLLQQIKPAILITDLNMPVMNGLELISSIVDSFSDWSVPVLIISGKDQHLASNPRVRYLSNWDVLKKPFSEEVLIDHVRPLLTLKP